jgi:hypothetical protein
MISPSKFLPNPSYLALRTQTADWTKNSFKKSLENNEATALEANKGYFRPPIDPSEAAISKFFDRVGWRNQMAKKMAGELAAEPFKQDTKIPVAKAGVTSSLGYNYIDLRGPAVLAYPVNTPLRNSMSRNGKVNLGVGVMAQWKTTKNPGYSYVGAIEGQRAQIGTPDENDYFAKYAELGHERLVSFTAQWAGEGFTDNLGDEHIRGLNVVFLGEEAMILTGNGGIGTGKLGTQFNGSGGATATPTPTGAVAATHTVGVAGNLSTVGFADLPYTTALTTSNFVSVAVVPLTAMGNPANPQYGYTGIPPTIGGGLVPSYTYNAPGTAQTITVNGGVGKISPISTPVQATSGNLTIKFQVPAGSLPIKNCYGYAWFVDVESSNTGSLAAATLAGITTVPFCYVSGTSTGAYAGNSAGLSTDNSYNTTDFDGLLTYAAKSGYYVDLYGGSLTSEKNGRVLEIENMLLYFFQNFQTSPTRLWCSADAANALDQAIRWSGAGTGGAFSGFQFMVNRDQQGNMLGGFIVANYQSRYAVANPTGGTVIPISIHPMMPLGTIYADFEEIPYPTSRAPFSRGLDIQREYYGIEWPMTQRAFPWGTYVQETLAHYFPWLSAVITGIGPFVGN